jgi:lipopolysaccharide export system protein LptA
VDQSGDVHLRQLDRTAQADLSHFDRLTDTAVLSGSVALADAQSRVTAQTVTFHQLANEFHAEGHVVSSEVSAQEGGTTNLAPGPARISADSLVANSLSGQALYSGHARLWQGDSLIQADTINLDRATHVLTATNHVRAVFPQAAWAPSGPLASGQPKPSQARPAASDKPEFWRAEADRMTYFSEQGCGRLEQNVYTHSSEGAIRADAVDLFFAPAGAPASLAQGTAASQAGSKAGLAGAAPGGQQLIRATAIGKVLVEQEDRRGTSSRADYTASEGKFVLSGGPPIVYDSSGNSTTGRQLTLFFADDRIVIDSAEGLRTLTLHRVEK